MQVYVSPSTDTTAVNQNRLKARDLSEYVDYLKAKHTTTNFACNAARVRAWSLRRILRSFFFNGFTLRMKVDEGRQRWLRVLEHDSDSTRIFDTF